MTFHCWWLGFHWGSTACRTLCTFLVCQSTTCPCSSKFFHFLLMMTSNPIWLDSEGYQKLEWEMQWRWLPQWWQKWYILLFISIQINIQWCFLSSCSGDERTHTFFGAQSLCHLCTAKGDKFQYQSFVMLCQHCKCCLKYILFTYHFTYVLCKS